MPRVIQAVVLTIQEAREELLDYYVNWIKNNEDIGQILKNGISKHVPDIGAMDDKEVIRYYRAKKVGHNHVVSVGAERLYIDLAKQAGKSCYQIGWTIDDLSDEEKEQYNLSKLNAEHIVKEMIQILSSKDSDENEKLFALDTLSETLFPYGI